MRALLLLGLVLILLGGLVALKLMDAGREPVEALEVDPGEGVVILGVDPNQERAAEQVVPATQSEPANHPGQAQRANPPAGNDTPAAGSRPRVVYHPPEPAEEARGVVIYTVRPGDNLYKIVERSYGRYSKKIQDAIVAENGLDDPSKIRPNDELRLPVVDGYAAPKPN